MDVDFVKLYFWEVFAPLVLLLVLFGLKFRKIAIAAGVALLLTVLLAGCKEVDELKGKRTLYPDEVARLERVCTTQEGFSRSWVASYKGEAKKVTCFYRSKMNKELSIDAEILEIRILEGLQ